MARQWYKAVQIVDMLSPAQAGDHYQLLATHFASSRDFAVAEKYFLKADMTQVYAPYMDLYIQCTVY